MTFPSLVGTAVYTSFATDTTSHDINLYSTHTSGNLILLFFCDDGGDDMTLPTQQGTWTEIAEYTAFASKSRTGVWAKVSDGTEGGNTVDVVTSGVESGRAAVWEIQDWGGTIATDIDVSAGATSNGSSCDPDSVTAGWGADDNLFISVGGSDSNDVVTTWDANYSLHRNSVNPGGNGGVLHLSARELNASSDDPGAMTLAGAQENVGFTIVIKPAAAAGTTATAVVATGTGAGIDAAAAVGATGGTATGTGAGVDATIDTAAGGAMTAILAAIA